MRLDIIDINIRSLSWLRRLTNRNSWLYRVSILIGLYAFFVLVVRLVTLSFITYFTISPTSRFQDISDAFSSNEVSLMGLAALFFVGLLCKLNPLTTTTTTEVITRDQIEKSFLPGFIQGTVFAG